MALFFAGVPIVATFIAIVAFFGEVLSTTITVVNQCNTAGPIEFTNTNVNGMTLQPGQSTAAVTVQSGWSGRVSFDPQPSTLAEFTITGQNNKNTMDISLVDGFNVGLGISYTGGNCIRNGQSSSSSIVCKISIGQCPGQYISGNRCVNPNRDAQTGYSSTVKGICPDAYSWSKDDASSTFTCDVGGDYTVTFCP